MEFLCRLNTRIEHMFMAICVSLLIVLASVVFLQIVFRNMLKIPMMWSIETALFCFVWAVFLGAAVGLRHRRHYTVEIFPEKFVRVNLILEIVSHFFVLAMVYVFVFHGYSFAVMGFSKLSTTIAMPQGYFYLSMPIAGVAMVLFSIELLMIDIKQMIDLSRVGNTKK